jgi:hypothetical protein
VYRLTEDVIMEFLPPGDKGGVSCGYGHKRGGVDSGTAHVTEDSATMHEFYDFLSGLEEFMQKKSWGHLAAPKLPSHYIGLIIFISTTGQPSSIEFSRQHAWADYDVKDFEESPILAVGFKREFAGENQSVIVQIREPERILETFEEQLKKLADVLLNKNS